MLDRTALGLLGGLTLASNALVYAAPQASTVTSPAGFNTGVPTITTDTSTASPTVPLTNTLPSQQPLPPTQAWCPSEIFCAGELLQTVNLAQLFPDPKTFVDKPTNKSSAEVLADFNAMLASVNNNTNSLTEQQLVNFVDTDFTGEGLELEAVALPNFNPNPAFLNNVTDPTLKAWAQTVHSFWTQLARNTNDSVLCGEGNNGGKCESSLIPLNHTFVIPGGRFREQYYWDSYWIVLGLLDSELFEVANNTLQNFMDELETLKFIPNGGRIYYLNRSQPPVFIHMLSAYVSTTGDTSILQRALPLAEVELEFWNNNRTMSVTSPFTNKTYSVARYAVNNTAPRPESYLTDYLTANDPSLPTLTQEEEEALYGELASGAETGWDYTVRFSKTPFAGGTNNTNPVLRSLNIKNTIPVDLNSILFKAHSLLADLYTQSGSSNSTAISNHQQAASNLREAILDLFWDSNKLGFYDFNLTSNARNDFFSAAHFYPAWSGIFADEVLSNETAAFGYFSSLNMVMNRFNGTLPTTFVESGLQWDAPNAWPPHQFIAINALRNLPSNLSTGGIPAPPSGQSSFGLIPSGQLGISESQLPGQQIRFTNSNSSNADLNALNGTVVNGGNATSGETWVQILQREMANRYFTSALCSWRATGGSIPNVLPRLSDADLQSTASANNTGNMFEKFSYSNVDSSGQGGEYTVQAGFGWTNGVALWVAANYGQQLVLPDCPPILLQDATGSSKASGALSTYAASKAMVLASTVLGLVTMLF